MYELYILGELMDRPYHGYLLQMIINRVVGPIRKISWGVLYPLIHELEEDHLIEEVEVTTEGKGRKKKTYQITPLGKERFYRLMEEPIEYKSDYEVHFYIKVSNIDHVTRDVALVIYHHYKDYLRYLRRHIEELKAHVEGEDNIPKNEVPNILSVLEHRLLQNQVSEEWVLKKIEELKENG
ncbi:DNA-binding PadR family transcriptional regulator [Pullulanibacillus pueri]|uniref:PadR family transcriptional regulator n=1 Tax=Pullulanibacillus pueri TaxID=1437324 RepID=A0A8J3ELS6_9BACL|nr:PadR family transcriptional regulator [Pullulanibacillus pueri]MBM7681314.1 DNA-binding PadR family transcriptional regulator [Pullulanibacillus pueri]GGH77627.1 PadR family transcriptional regulator [Pullulanibacillus pueri]